ncbi:DUF192 domain-containing protein [Treponema sp. OMZ 305]|uniref:DUF192 domain-containing protein n=1 Tax=Treponema TaxID=157 RepID=UPI001BAF4A6F|nr:MULTISPECIES: DUF192 domain-containing protein [Treponema]QUY18676.1 DUF192 domain-containing protein [Treponema vincentii]UTC58574.1 DUF192 domain-containing protein [Treponema sp. OMZ 305]
MYLYSIKKDFRHLSAAVYILIFAAATVSCTGTERPKASPITITIESKKTGTGISIDVELAVTAQEQQRGFMHRKEIPGGTGMIFVFKRDQKLRFWMKDTPHPLSIAFIDSTGCVREIYDMQPFSLDITASTYSVRYALEVAQGYFERAGISAGDMLSPESLEHLKAEAQQ